MNNYPSPRTPGSTPMSPIREWDYSRMSSATPTPSPRPNWIDAQTPRRPATRASHGRVNSYSQSAFSPRPPRDSPRYNSSGEYATVDVSYHDFSSREPFEPHNRSSKTPKSPKKHRDNRRHSFTYVRSSTPYGESDEDEIIEAMGRTYMLPAQSRSRDRRSTHFSPDDRVRYTNGGHFEQDIPYYNEAVYGREPAYESRPMPPTRPPTSHSHMRRSSASIPQRSSTVRPTGNASPRVPRQPPPPPKATEEDAARHQIPAGFSLKNWDPREEPILLLGSVFDANSLGKWIYDWTVYKVGSREPLAEMAGEMWLLLLELSEKTGRAERLVGRVRSKEKKQLVEEFLDSSGRLMATLQYLLKNCEAPMLKASKKKHSGLGKNAGIEFVDTLFGRDRELLRTEKFMQKVRKWSLRYEANVAPILDNPTL